jgi:hypothetical protein
MLRASSTSESHIPMRRLSQTVEETEPHLCSSFSNPLRRSITADSRPVSPGYRNSFPSVSTPAIPSVSLLFGDENGGLPPSRFKILPREEEGREELPPYTCSLHREAMLERKMELQSREWHFVRGQEDGRNGRDVLMRGIFLQLSNELIAAAGASATWSFTAQSSRSTRRDGSRGIPGSPRRSMPRNQLAGGRVRCWKATHSSSPRSVRPPTIRSECIRPGSARGMVLTLGMQEALRHQVAGPSGTVHDLVPYIGAVP